MLLATWGQQKKLKTLSLYLNIKHLPIYTFNRHRATLSHIWSHVYPPDEWFGLHHLLRKKVWLFICKCPIMFTS